MELPTKLLIGATVLIIVVLIAAINPAILIVLGLLGVLGTILALLGSGAETTAALTTVMKALRQSIRLLTSTFYST